ncbi:hypothetical protein ACFCWY_27705 [Streptomyces sp. NPDC056362]|uniref:hypothetical protein n=1 Tax=unclassified Streptomyces TaxID=2593676 RepID=UPI0035E06CEE
MTTATTTELDVLGALLAFDFIGFAQKSAALDPADARYGRAVGCAFGLAARRRFPRGAHPEEVRAYVAWFLGSLEAGAEDFDAAVLEALIFAGLDGDGGQGPGPADPERTMQARLVLTLRWVRELELGPEEQRELLAQAGRRVAV